MKMCAFYWFLLHICIYIYIYHNAQFKKCKTSDQFGLSYSQIILMVADDMAFSPRNWCLATVFNNSNQHISV